MPGPTVLTEAVAARKRQTCKSAESYEWTGVISDQFLDNWLWQFWTQLQAMHAAPREL